MSIRAYTPPLKGGCRVPFRRFSAETLPHVLPETGPSTKILGILRLSALKAHDRLSGRRAVTQAYCGSTLPRARLDKTTITDVYYPAQRIYTSIAVVTASLRFLGIWCLALGCRAHGRLWAYRLNMCRAVGVVLFSRLTFPALLVFCIARLAHIFPVSGVLRCRLSWAGWRSVA